ncbi:uncharacterized protein ACRADG_004849 isoform 2-T2 [Cochliomyia hominivorax]
MFYLKYLIAILFVVIGVSSELHDIEDMKLLFFTQLENVKKSIDILEFQVNNLSEKNSIKSCDNKFSSQIFERLDTVQKSLNALMTPESDNDKLKQQQINTELEELQIQKREKQIQRINDLEKNYSNLIELFNAVRKSEERLIEKNADLEEKTLKISVEGKNRTNSINMLFKEVESLSQNNLDLEAKYLELYKLYENVSSANDILEKRLYTMAEHESDLLSNLEELKIFEQNKVEFDIRVDKLPKLKQSCVEQTIPTDCATATKCTNKSGYYNISVSGTETKEILVYCDTETNGGGWLHILRRHNSSNDFSRPWSDYVHGFGDVELNYWLGLENLHALTNNNGQQELYIYIKNSGEESRFAHYDNFVVGNSSEFYELKSVGTYNGTAGDVMAYIVGTKFSTTDVDNDTWENRSCASRYESGWWYGECADLVPTAYFGERVIYFMIRKVKNYFN